MDDKKVETTWWTLRLTYGLVPIVAGLDKFTNILVDWEQYLSPFAARILPFSPTVFMYMVGVIEVIAGILVLSRATTRIGGYVVSAWLVAIAVNLVMGGFYDIAVRDTVMAIGAFSYARLTEALGETAPARARRRDRFGHAVPVGT